MFTGMVDINGLVGPFSFLISSLDEMVGPSVSSVTPVLGLPNQLCAASLRAASLRAASKLSGAITDLVLWSNRRGSAQRGTPVCGSS